MNIFAFVELKAMVAALLGWFHWKCVRGMAAELGC
jgi:hypothetical protein